MYIVIFDKYLIKGEERLYGVCRGEQYEMLSQEIQDIDGLKKEDIEEILVFSGKEDSLRKALTVQCESVEKIENGIKFTYGKVDELESTCDEIKRRLYGYCRKNNIAEGRFAYAVQNPKDYSYLKGERLQAKHRSIMNKVDELKQKNDWEGIAKLFPSESEIANSMYWDEFTCLSELSFAISKLEDNYSKKTHNKEKRALGRFFLKLSDRCLELEPNSNKALSSRAYFLYNRYNNYSNIDDYEEAYEIYERLIQSSSEKFKEAYRFTKLKEKNFENRAASGVLVGKDWINAINEIQKEYSQLADEYPQLDEEQKKRRKKEYIKTLFGYSKFVINQLLNYWDVYFNMKQYGIQPREYTTKEERITVIKTIDKYLEEVHSLLGCSNPTIENINQKPSYFDVKYRLAQIKQIEGFVYIFKGYDEDTHRKYFIESNAHLEELFATVKNYKGNEKAKFNFPSYAKIPQAVNDFILGDTKNCHGRFYRAKPYMQYEEARLYALEGDNESAKRILMAIPPEDKCYNKSQRLLRDLENEGRQNI